MTGDQADMVSRLKSTLPARWFPDSTPVLDGLLSGLAWSWSWLFAMLAYVRLQTRLATATDQSLDQIANDCLGSRLFRRGAEPDQAYRRRIGLELLRDRATRQALVGALTDLTGRAPVIFEPSRPADTGAWNGPLGYGLAGGWGSLLLPFQAFVTAYRAQGSGIANTAGYGGPAGYGQGAFQYASLAMLTGQVTDADITTAIAGVMPTASIAWTRISN